MVPEVGAERVEERDQEAGKEPQTLGRASGAFQVSRRGVEKGQGTLGDRGQRTVRCPGQH